MSHDADRADLLAQLRQLQADQARIRNTLLERDRRFQHLARSVFRVTESERRRLARDLHDGVGQKLSAAMHRLSQLQANPALTVREHADLDALAALVADCLHDIRNLSRLMRPQILDDLGLVPALQWLFRSFREHHGLDITDDIQELGLALDDDLNTVVFRLIQEALSNVAKHAGASQVVVRLARKTSAIHVLIADNGRGCDIEQALGQGSTSQSTGLSGMQERVHLFGGTIQFHSAPMDGMQIRVSIPLPDAASPVAP
ncbi:sensor histidine kinase [Ahniella affigens]|uniref:histidine kinase n=2 Tax=Ahniella affigens TaxID=2021234 RepID=A0A2P1PUA2_9GAMM|nr:sensor histidine kinase [Ahniella affigens]